MRSTALLKRTSEVLIFVVLKEERLRAATPKKERKSSKSVAYNAKSQAKK